MTLKPRKPYLAAVLNFLVSGLGHLYAGQAARFFVILAAILTAYFLLGLTGWLSTFTGFVCAFGLVILYKLFLIFDGFRLAKHGSFAPRWYNKWYFYLMHFVFMAVLFLALAHLREPLFGYGIYHIPSGSMAPDILKGDFILVDSRFYRHHLPMPGEIAVVHLPQGDYVRHIKARLADDIEIIIRKPIPRAGVETIRVPISTLVGRAKCVAFSFDMSRIGREVMQPPPSP